MQTLARSRMLLAHSECVRKLYKNDNQIYDHVEEVVETGDRD